MHGGESDGRRVPTKCPNNGEQSPAEGTEVELRRRWYQPVAEVGKWLRVIQGYFNYYAVCGNMDSLNSFRAQVIWRWHRALRRRSQRDRRTSERAGSLVDRCIPSAKILPPHPNLRFDARYPR